MIGYLEGSILKKDEDRILLLVSHVGYEILIPVFVLDTIKDKNAGDQLSLYIWYQQTERQPKPVLIGFNTEEEKEFFQHFISVEAIGPLKAVKALCMPMSEIASAIEAEDADILKNLKGIGARTAQKIIATLSGKMERFALMQDKTRKFPVLSARITEKVMEVLTDQLGHKVPEAREMIAEAFKRNSGISTPEELFDEIYRGGKME